MRNLRQRMPRSWLSMVTAVVALFVALGGSAYAAQRFLITSTSQIRPNVLVKLHGATGVQGPQGPAGTAGPAGPAGPQGPAGLQGPQGQAVTVSGAVVVGPTGPAGAQGVPGPAGVQGPVGPAGGFALSKIAYRVSGQSTVASGTTVYLSAACGPGEYVIGGGWSGYYGTAVASYPSHYGSTTTADVWSVEMANTSGYTSYVTVYAICAGA